MNTEQDRADQRVRTVCQLILTVIAVGAALSLLRPVLVPFCLALLLTYFEVWPERVLGAVFGDPARLWEYDPDGRKPGRRRKD